MHTHLSMIVSMYHHLLLTLVLLQLHVVHSLCPHDHTTFCTMAVRDFLAGATLFTTTRAEEESAAFLADFLTMATGLFTTIPDDGDFFAGPTEFLMTTDDGGFFASAAAFLVTTEYDGVFLTGMTAFFVTTAEARDFFTGGPATCAYVLSTVGVTAVLDLLFGLQKGS
jgi:hypothetical protein